MLADKIWLLSYKAMAIGFIVIALCIAIKIILKKTTGSSDIKGIAKNKDKINDTIKGSGLIKSREQKGFVFGKASKDYVCLDSQSEGHIAIFGPSGKGKTSALLIPSLRVWTGSFFVIDISGDISKNVKIKDDEKVLLSPDEPSESVLYNAFHIIDEAADGEEKREKLERLVNLIIDISDNANDTQRYFLQTARKIFLASMIAFYNIGMDFTDICKTVFFNNVADLAKMILDTENELAIGYIKPVTLENEKNVGGAKGALNDKIKLFADNKKMEQILRRPIRDFDGNIEPCFYPSQLEEKKVFVKIPDKKQEFFASFMHIVTAQVLEYISARAYEPEKDKRILLGLDEFASIGHFEIISPFRKFRKNGANICILTQSLVDIDLVYSEKERQVILDNSQYVVILGATENSTREYFSNLVGKEEMKATSVSSGRGGSSTSVSTKREYVLSPESWKSYDKELVVVHPAGYIKLKKNYYYKN